MSDETYDWEVDRRATVDTVVDRLVRRGFHQRNLPDRSVVSIALVSAGLPVRDIDRVLSELSEVVDDPFPGMKR